MLVYAHKLYAPAFTCTHHNDVMYTCKQMQTHTHTHTHLYALTHAHPHTQTCCCPRRRLCMLQAHVFGSSKCMQKRRVVSVYMLTHTHTHTYTRTYSTPGTQKQAYTTETPLWQYADQTAHASSHRKTVLPPRKKMFCAQFLDVIHSSHRWQSNPI